MWTEAWSHHIFASGGKPLDDSLLDVAAGTGDAIAGQRLLLLPLSHAVSQEVDLDCHRAHAFLDLPMAGRG